MPRENGNALLGYQLLVDEGPSGNKTTLVLGADGSYLSAYTDCTQLSASPTRIAASYGSTLEHVLMGLRDGIAFAINISACNAIGPSKVAACVCADPLCLPGCSSAPIPAFTFAVPISPAAPIQVTDPALDPLKSRGLFIAWSPPKEGHGLPVLQVHARINDVEAFASPDASSVPAASRRRLQDNATDGAKDAAASKIKVSISQSALNVTGLKPAEQYGISVRMQNKVGWGAWSPTAWHATKPEAPDAPPGPTCEDTNPNGFKVDFEEAVNNGLPVIEYEVLVCNFTNGTGGAYDKDAFVVLYSALVPASTLPLAWTVTRDLVRDYSFQVSKLRAEDGGNWTLAPMAEYSVFARARNDFGWGPWSHMGSGCTTTATLGFMDIIAIIVGLAGTLLLVVCCVVIWKCTEVPKIFAPKLRRREPNTDPLEDFIVKEDTAMEDLDPELNMNPVLLAKIAIETEQGLRRKTKRGKGGGGAATGGLRRLGINFEDKEKNEGDKKVGLKEIDVRLQTQAKAEKEEKRLKKEVDQRIAREEAESAAKKKGGVNADEVLEMQIARKKTGASPIDASTRDSTGRKSKLPPPARPSLTGGRGDDAVDMSRTLTYRTKARREKNKALATDRMVAKAEAATLRADRAKMARAAAHLPTIPDRSTSQQTSRDSDLDEEMSSTPHRLSANL